MQAMIGITQELGLMWLHKEGITLLIPIHLALSGAYYVNAEEPPEEYPFSGRIDFYYGTGEKSFFQSREPSSLSPWNNAPFCPSLLWQRKAHLP